jgi:hypothetical protein
MEWLTIFAIILGPITAVQAQKWIERATEKQRQRVEIFKTLMSMRAYPLSLPHVNALNTINLVFTGKDKPDTEVRRKWEIYLNKLLEPFPESEPDQKIFVDDRTKRLTDLLVVLAKALHFKLDEEDIRRVYVPIAHTQEILENQVIRQLLVQLLHGKLALKTEATLFPSKPEAAEKFHELLFAVLEGERALKIEESNPPK